MKKEKQNLINKNYKHNNKENNIERPIKVDICRMRVPVHRKTFITLEEAAELTGIGQSKLKEISNDDNCDFVLWNGKKRLFKREKLIKYLENQFSI